jgi:hypothetical protein
LLVEQDDPEQRIAELERQLAEQKRMAQLQRHRPEPVGQPPQVLDARAAAQGEPIRCVLNRVPTGFVDAQQAPQMVALDIGQDAIVVRQMVYARASFRQAWAPSTYKLPPFDPDKSVLLASVGRAQVTATPAAFIPAPKRDSGFTQPVLIVRVPGLEPLTIGCKEWIGHLPSPPFLPSPSDLRFWWRGKVPWVKPHYSVSGGDWLTLVEIFGLGPYLEDKASGRPDWGAREWSVSPQELAAVADTARDRRPVWYWVFPALLAGTALFLFALVGVRSAEYYLLGTPTTATVTDCKWDSGCRGTWSIDGVSQTGPLEIGDDDTARPPVGSSLDVRVSFGTARTAPSPHALLGVAVVGGVLLAFSILVFGYGGSRTGRLVGKP